MRSNLGGDLDNESYACSMQTSTLPLLGERQNLKPNTNPSVEMRVSCKIGLLYTVTQVQPWNSSLGLRKLYPVWPFQPLF